MSEANVKVSPRADRNLALRLFVVKHTDLKDHLTGKELLEYLFGKKEEEIEVATPIIREGSN
jgi:hypothetical protein